MANVTEKERELLDFVYAALDPELTGFDDVSELKIQALLEYARVLAAKWF